MAVTAAIRRFVAAGFTLEEALVAAEIFEAEMEPKTRSSGAIRQARYRAKLRDEVTESDVTVTRNSDASLGEKPPPKSNIKPPEPSLRSEIVSARRAAWLRFKEAYPKRPGHSWQPAEEKFYRWIKSGVDPEAMIAGAEAYARSRAAEDPKYTKAPLVFLNRQCWKDDHEPTLFQPANGARASPGSAPQRRNPFFAAVQRDRAH